MNKRIIGFVVGFWMLCFQAIFAQEFFQKVYSLKQEKEIHTRDLDKLDNNRFIISGHVIENGINGYLQCVDSLGVQQWVNSYGVNAYNGSNDHEFTTVEITKDKKILAGGRYKSGINGQQSDAYLVKTNEDGALIWSRVFGLTADYDEIKEIHEDELGNIYCVGTFNSNSGSFLIKLDSNGGLIWQKKYTSSTIGETFSLYSFCILPSGEILACGDAQLYPDNYSVILKLDSSGNLIWAKKYTGNDPFVLRKIIPTNDYKFLLSGSAFSYSTYLDQQIIMKINEEGSVIWNKIAVSSFGNRGDFGGVVVAPNGRDIYLPGFHLNPDFQHSQSILSKFSENGNYLWSKEYGGCAEETLYGVEFGSSSTLILAGITTSYGIHYRSSGYLVRSDTSGYTSCYDDGVDQKFTDWNVGIAVFETTISPGDFSYDTYIPVVKSILVSDSIICSSNNPVGVLFNASDTLICKGSCISFQDSSVVHQAVSFNFPLLNGIVQSKETKYQWRFPGATFSDGSDTLQNPTNICYNTEGKHDVTLLLTMGCRQDSLVLKDYIHVTSSTPDLVITGDSSICGGGTAQLVVSGAKTYSWSPTTGLNDSTNDTIIATPTQTTTYTVTGSLGGNCIGMKQVTIAVGNAVTANAGANDTICSGESATLTGSGGQTFTWSSNQTTREITISPLTTTAYIFTAVDGSCKDEDTVQVVVNESPTVTLTPSSTEIEQGGSVNLETTGGGIYAWSPTTGLSCTDCSTPIATPEMTTDYVVTVTSQNGCSSSQTTHITIKYNCGELFVPNSFSPNGDNINDKLDVKINEACIIEYNFQIFDRWGELVFKATKISESWDGKFDGKELDSAVFVYKLKMKLMNEPKYIEKKGNVSIIK